MEKVSERYRIGMGMVVFALVLFCAAAADRVYAAEEELPCAEEIAKYCKDVKPGGGRILNCLDEHQKELSATCRKKLEEAKTKLTEARQACEGDMEKFCKDVQPGGGRILKCLREHSDELSPACKKMAGKREEKMRGEEGPGSKGN